jgi:cobalt-zinc-cadmium efflux system membrane fusion protein
MTPRRASHFLTTSLWVAASLGLSVGCGPRNIEPPVAPQFVRSAGKIILPEGSPLRHRLEYVAVDEAIVTADRRYPGTIEPVPGRSIRVFPPAAGRVAAVHVGLGDRVTEGQPLVSLHSPEFVEAQGEFLKARSAALFAERNLERRRALRDGKVAAQRDIEEAEIEVEIAQADLAAARERLMLLGGDPEAVTFGGLLVLRSPLEGKVIDLRAAVGELYREDEEDPLAIVADLQRVWLNVSVPERDAGLLRAGAEVEASLAAVPGRTFSGSVAIVGDFVETETRSVQVRVALDNSDRLLKPGMFGTVRLLGVPVRQLVVPATAVVVSGGDSFVFERTGEWELTPRRIRPGEAHANGLPVLEGLNAGAVVLARDGVLFQ